MSAKKISIIIPVYNSEKRIGRTLEAVLRAASSYRNSGGGLSEEGGRSVEVIVVDDGSTDKTKDEIAKFSTVKYFFQQNAGPAAARNAGAQEADGEFLFFTDADCLPHPDWIETIMPHFGKPNVAVVAGSYGIANSDNRLSRCIHREIIFRHMILMPEYPSYFGSFNFAIRREVFVGLDGFNTQYRSASGEDNDLSYKIVAHGYKIYFAKDALVDHFHPEQLNEYLKQQYRHGFWRVAMYRDHPKMAKGDGYTFGKDIIEVGLVLFFYFSFVLIFTGFFSVGVWVMLGSVLALLVTNCYFGVKIVGEWRDGIYFGDVMVLRAFARTNGFLSGSQNLFVFSRKTGLSEQKMK